MTETRKRLWTVALACTAVLALLAGAGCTSGSPGNPTSPAGAGGGTNAAVGAAGVWREFVACARTNGQQNMPDAAVDTAGQVTFPEVAGFDMKTAYDAVREPCGAILDRLPAGANPFVAQPMTPEELETMRRYVECLRVNGMPDMPDPGPNGEIRDPERYQTDPALQQARVAARTACDPILLGR